jgi:hypothetical protein
METGTKKVTFEVPKREQVSQNNHTIFDYMQSAFVKVPTSINETALAGYLALQNRKILSLQKKEKS